MNWNLWLAIGLGGMIGSLGRHGCNQMALKWLGDAFPWGTAVANLLGSFAIGWLFHSAQRDGWLNSYWEVTFRVGLLGGLTTFSSLSLETIRLLQNDRPVAAIVVVIMNLVGGLVAVLAGMKFGSWLRV
jgi:CrcB protein